MESVRVAMVCRDYPPDIGGIPTSTHALVQALGKLGVSVDVFATRTDFRTTILPLKRGFRKEKYDIVHYQGAPFAAFARHPLVITFHSPVLEEGKYYERKNKLKLPAASILEALSLRRADAIIVQSSVNMAEVKSRYESLLEKVSLIPCGAEVDRFVPSKQGGTARILICSRLVPRKNIQESLDAIAMVRGHYELDIVGDGPEGEKLSRIASELSLKAKFRGTLPEAELAAAFNTADIFVSSSLSEGFGLSVLQALSAGCAVVCSDIAAHRELVTHMDNGIVYQGKDELAHYLQMLVDDRDLVVRLGTRARERALSYSWDQVAKDTLGLYHSVIARRSG